MANEKQIKLDSNKVLHDNKWHHMQAAAGVHALWVRGETWVTQSHRKIYFSSWYFDYRPILPSVPRDKGGLEEG